MATYTVTEQEIAALAREYEEQHGHEPAAARTAAELEAFEAEQVDLDAIRREWSEPSEDLPL